MVIDATENTDVPAVDLDHTRFKQVVLNLLSNAVKYNRDGGTVTLACREDEGMLSVAVSDTGLGIPEDRHDAIFGLTLARELVELMDGTIGLESKIGTGSTFRITVPLARGDACSRRRPRPSELGGGPARPGNGAVHTILYIEDNPSNLRLMEETVAMSAEKPRLLSAVTAEHGIEIAKEVDPDLIILDLNLPGMNGFDALHHLRSLPKMRKTPVIALTASAMPAVMEQCREAGFHDFLVKPVDILQLVGTINHHLEKGT